MAQSTCDVPGCDRQHYGDGYCNPHWRRWKRTGTTGTAPIATRRTACSVEGCEDPHSARGYCASHYARWRRKGDAGGAFTTRRRNPSERDHLGRKRCRVCDAWLVETEFYKSSDNADGLGNECKKCHRETGLNRRYGIDSTWYDETLSQQNGGCAICGSAPGGGRRMHVDHDHSHCDGDRGCRACVRGILCSACNTGIGMLGEDAARLFAAAAYLQEHGARGGSRGRSQV